MRKLRVVVTDSSRGMEELETVSVENGSVKYILDPMSYTTLVSGKWDP